MADALFVYGTLAPGRKNHHRLEHLQGHWQAGRVYGRLILAGWAAAEGYPGMRPDPDGEAIQGYVFSSDSLSSIWNELDAFEGNDYERTPIQVYCDNGDQIQAFIYALTQSCK